MADSREDKALVIVSSHSLLIQKQSIVKKKKALLFGEWLLGLKKKRIVNPNRFSSTNPGLVYSFFFAVLF